MTCARGTTAANSLSSAAGRREGDVGREPRRERRELVGVRRPHAEQLRPEAHRVLDGVKALEDHQARVAPGALHITEFDHSSRRY